MIRWRLTALLYGYTSLFAATAMGGLSSEDGLDDGYWETHAVLYVEFGEAHAIEGDAQIHAIDLNVKAVLTGHFDAAESPQIQARLHWGGGWGTAIPRKPQIGMHGFIVIEKHVSDDTETFVIDSQRIKYMPYGEGIYELKPDGSTSAQAWSYITAQLARVRQGQAPLDRDELEPPPLVSRKKGHVFQ